MGGMDARWPAAASPGVAGRRGSIGRSPVERLDRARYTTILSPISATTTANPGAQCRDRQGMGETRDLGGRGTRSQYDAENVVPRIRQGEPLPESEPGAATPFAPRCTKDLIEVWDLMDALGPGSQALLGGYGSLWRRPRTALPLVMGNEPLPDDPIA
jgi:hypothetical protein